MVVGEIPESADVIVIGAGPGGYVAAIRAAQLGREVLLIDAMKELGGECLNFGCIPSKGLIHVANFYHDIEKAKDFGVTVSGKSLDVAQVQQWKNAFVSKLNSGVAQLCKENMVSVLNGRAHFTSDKSLQVDTSEGTKVFEFKHVIIASGSRAVELPGLAFDASNGVLSAREALSLKSVPKTMAVIGAGYIGIELGMVYAKFGSQVTIIEALDRILPEVDADLAKPVAKELKKLNVTTILNAKASAYSDGKLKIEGGDDVSAECVLVAVGRRPNSQDLGLDKTAVTVDESGFIQTDDQCRTTNEKVFAIGDVTRGPMLAQKASAEGKVAAEVLCGEAAAFDQVVPAVIFSEPEIATVGLMEDEAKAQGIDIVVRKFPLAALGRAMASHATEGLVKVIAEAESKRILGVGIVGAHASDLIAEATLAIEMGALAEDLALTIHTHPTFAEAIAEAVEMIYGRAIHISPKKQLK